MKITLTTWQANTIKEALGWAYNDDFPAYDSTNAHILRLIAKIEREQQKELHV